MRISDWSSDVCSSDLHQKAAAAVVVLVVRLEVIGQRIDAVGQDRDLDFRRTGIALVAGIVLDDFGFALGGNRHIQTSFEHPCYRLKPRTTFSVPANASIRATGRMSLSLPHSSQSSVATPAIGRATCRERVRQ